MDPPGYKLADGKLRDHGEPGRASGRWGLYHIDMVTKYVLCVIIKPFEHSHTRTILGNTFFVNAPNLFFPKIELYCR